MTDDRSVYIHMPTVEQTYERLSRHAGFLMVDLYLRALTLGKTLKPAAEIPLTLSQIADRLRIGPDRARQALRELIQRRYIGRVRPGIYKILRPMPQPQPGDEVIGKPSCETDSRHNFSTGPNGTF